MSSRRDHLVDTATKLFCKQGFRATGIDTVLAESGVAKKTLYNHFRSKDELIIAALQNKDEEFMTAAREGIARHASEQTGDPRMARVLALFDTLDEWANDDSYSGCAFVNASAEFPRRDDPIHVACTNHKKLVIQFVEELLSDLQLADSQQAARQIALLIEGSMVTAHTMCDASSVPLAKDTARRLLETYTTSK